MADRSRILFPTDFSEASENALPYAVRLSLALDSELHMLHAEVLHDLDPDAADEFPDLYDLLRAAHEKTGRTFESLNPNAGSEIDVVEIERRGVSAAPVILDYANEAKCELIVMATQGRRGLSRLMLGSVATEVVRNAKIPVLTVPKSWRATELPALIAATIDFSEGSDRVLEYAATLSALSGAEVDLVHVVDIPSSFAIYEAMPEIPIDVFEGLEKEATAKLEQKIAATGIDRNNANLRTLRGPVRATLLDWVKDRQPDLVIQASHGHHGVTRFLLGSVAETMVNRCECPVLTVRP